MHHFADCADQNSRHNLFFGNPSLGSVRIATHVGKEGACGLRDEFTGCELVAWAVRSVLRDRRIQGPGWGAGDQRLQQKRYGDPQQTGCPAGKDIRRIVHTHRDPAAANEPRQAERESYE